LLDPIGYFAVGIIGRLFYPTVAGKIKNLNLILASIVLFYALVGNGPLAVWSIVYLGFILHPSVNGIFVQGYRLALEGHLATYFGSRSYSIYLGHFPVIVAVMWLWITLFSSPPGFLPLLAMAVPATILTAEILYRVVEIPGINLGSRWARRSMNLERYDHDLRTPTGSPAPQG
jgi:peptidoglycan/LPS O-acetylase OafA/YrhL